MKKGGGYEEEEEEEEDSVSQERGNRSPARGKRRRCKEVDPEAIKTSFPHPSLSTVAPSPEGH